MLVVITKCLWQNLIFSCKLREFFFPLTKLMKYWDLRKAMFFTFPECKKLTNITLKLWNKGFWQPILCYWPLYIPTEKIRKPEIFWFFQGAQKGTSGMKWARKRERERESFFFMRSRVSAFGWKSFINLCQWIQRVSLQLKKTSTF